MTYKLDNIPLSSFDALPGRSNQAFALEGMLDLPKRISSAEHDWGTSIEPFVQTEDIQLDGRTLTLYAVVKSEKVNAFKSACVACKVLSFDYDSFNVACRDEIEVIPVNQYDIVKAKFWQNNFMLKPITVTPSVQGEYMLDNFNLNKDFRIVIEKSNSPANTAKRIEVATTEFYIRTNYRGTRETTLNCAMLGSGFADLYNKMNQFQAVLMQAGTRTLKIKNNVFNLYFKDGITVNIAGEKVLSFTLKAVCL
ncbi:MAG: hypothetical protein LBI45_08855 [Bacteroidales bacterium]|jgi:hypothetical protein|nr:hypothetical protein [Bacteroidales bacterium]